MALKQAGSDTVRYRINKELYGISAYLPDSSRHYAWLLHELALKIGKTEYLKDAISVLNNHYVHHSGNTDTILNLLKDFEKKMTLEKNIRGMASAYKMLGRLYMVHQLDSAMFYHLKCLELFRQEKDSSGMAGVLINIAAANFYLNKFQKSIEATWWPLEYAKLKNDLGRAGTSAVNLGVFHFKLQQYDSAKYYLEESYQYNYLRGDLTGMADASCHLGYVFMAYEEYSEAENRFLKAIEYGKRSGYEKTFFDSYSGLANLMTKINRPETALKYIKLADQYSLDNKDAQLELNRVYYQVYESMGNYKQAYLYHKKYIAFRDSMHGHDRAKLMEELETKYKTKEKQTELDQAKKESSYNASLASQGKVIRNGLVMLIIATILVSWLLFNRFRLKKKLETQVAITNERKRISTELHDDIGAQLSTAKMFLSSVKKSGAVTGNTDMVENSLNILDNSITDLRRIMTDLHASILQEKGLLVAVEDLVNRINQLNRINFQLSHHDMHERLPFNIEHQLFRITQELINNSMKYSEASIVKLEITKRTDDVVMIYNDNGKGVDLSSTTTGFGLKNIESRVHSLSGEVEFASKPGEGFQAIIDIPFKFKLMK